ncbi:MAG: UvrB/UvrC motif-containing protein [Planctomycetia bacterium]|nr:UvrB/UvrC motif-containing protein [Planctomycetia bacterium]
MSQDITDILIGWTFDPHKPTVRIITAPDGSEKIQMRLELGVLQMELSGRPDGTRVEGTESWLDYHVQQQQQRDAANPDGAPYLLEPEACEELLREGVQYYHRYISLWHLGRYELCARDTKRNLRLFAFVREHARRDRDKLQFDQWRPYVTMMHTRAVATPLVELGEMDAALGAIQAGIAAIERFLVEYGQQEQAEQCQELVHLKKWQEELTAGRTPTALPPAAVREALPPSPLEQLRSKLARAVTEERYEEAAQLRDEIRKLGDDSTQQA